MMNPLIVSSQYNADLDHVSHKAAKRDTWHELALVCLYVYDFNHDSL